MIDEKWFILSRSIWGGVLVIWPAVFAMFGWAWSGEDQSALDALSQAWDGNLASLSALIGAALNVYGRVAAKTKLTLVPKMGS